MKSNNNYSSVGHSGQPRSEDRKRQSRWDGGERGGRGRGDSDRNSRNDEGRFASVTSSSLEDDDEAIRALQQEAIEREQTTRRTTSRQQQQQQHPPQPGRRGGSYHGDNYQYHNNKNNNNNKRFRSSSSEYQDRKDGRNYRDNNKYEEERYRGRQRRDNNNNKNSSKDGADYYGPSTSVSQDNDDKKNHHHVPNFGLSGALTRDLGNNNNNNNAGHGGGVENRNIMRKGIVLKFQEPLEARIPNTHWRLYVFKNKKKNTKNNHSSSFKNKVDDPNSDNDDDDDDNNKPIETLHISKQSAYLIGRNQDICDIVLGHASCSSQHAVLQYRALPVSNTDNDNNNIAMTQQQQRLQCLPYLMDLESTNGTFINGIRLDAARYYQLKKGDVIQFAASTREYVLLTANTTSIA